MLNYLKRHLIISSILSLVITVCAAVYTSAARGYALPVTDWLLYFFGSFGVFVMFNIIAFIFFPDLVVKDTDVDVEQEPDADNYVEVYFYEGFQEGVARVVKIFGDQRYPNMLQREFNFINEDGNFIFEQWFLTAEPFKEGRTIVMDKNFKFNIGTLEGTLLSDRGFAMMSSDWSDGKVKVGDGEGNVNFVRVEDGSMVWANWRLEQVNYGDQE